MLTLWAGVVYNRISFLECTFYSNFCMIVINLVCNKVSFFLLEIAKVIHYGNRQRNNVLNKLN